MRKRAFMLHLLALAAAALLHVAQEMGCEVAADQALHALKAVIGVELLVSD